MRDDAGEKDNIYVSISCINNFHFVQRIRCGWMYISQTPGKGSQRPEYALIFRTPGCENER